MVRTAMPKLLAVVFRELVYFKKYKITATFFPDTQSTSVR